MGGNRAYRIFEDRPSGEVTKCQEFEERGRGGRERSVATAAAAAAAAAVVSANEEGEKERRENWRRPKNALCAQHQGGQYRDKIERITYRIPSVHTEKENGKCHVGRAKEEEEKEEGRARARAHGDGTNARKREPRKIRERAFTCVENLVRYRGPRPLQDGKGGHRGTNTIKEATARTTWNGQRAA